MSLFHAYTKVGKFPKMDYEALANIKGIEAELSQAQIKQTNNPESMFYVCNRIFQSDLDDRWMIGVEDDRRTEFSRIFDESVKEHASTVSSHGEIVLDMFGLIGWVICDAGIECKSRQIHQLAEQKEIQSSMKQIAFYRVMWINHMLTEIKKVLKKRNGA